MGLTGQGKGAGAKQLDGLAKGAFAGTPTLPRVEAAAWHDRCRGAA